MITPKSYKSFSPFLLSPNNADTAVTYISPFLLPTYDTHFSIGNIQTYLRETGSLPMNMNVSIKCPIRVWIVTHFPSTGREVDLMTRASLVAPLVRDLLLLRDTVTKEIRDRNVAHHTVAMMLHRAQALIPDRAMMPFRPIHTLEMA
jgi:hypothetical protein